MARLDDLIKANADMIALLKKYQSITHVLLEWTMKGDATNKSKAEYFDRIFDIWKSNC